MLSELGDPGCVDAGGDFEACGDGEGGAVDDGFLADVLDGGGVGDVEEAIFTGADFPKVASGLP